MFIAPHTNNMANTELKIRVKNSNSQSGITLMLAVLVLAAITAIAFSLAAIVMVEIRSSGDVLRTEPALYAALGVTEEAFFKYKRYVPDSGTNGLSISGCTPAPLSVCSINNVTLSSPAPTVRVYDTSPRVDTIYAGATNAILLVNPSTPNSYAQQYQSVRVTYLNNGASQNLTVTLCRYVTTSITPDCSLSSNLAPLGVFQYNSFASSGQYELRLRNTGSVGTQNILAKVEATDIGGVAQIPLLGTQVLDITANYLGLTRKYTTQIPLP
jgi:hypothetical protein